MTVSSTNHFSSDNHSAFKVSCFIKPFVETWYVNRDPKALILREIAVCQTQKGTRLTFGCQNAV